MALGLKIFHTPKPRGFNHVNIYYDPEKEEREERENRVNKELGIKQEEFKTSIKRGSFRRLHKIEGGGSGSDVLCIQSAMYCPFLMNVLQDPFPFSDSLWMMVLQ